MRGKYMSAATDKKAELLEKEGRVVELISEGHTMAEVAEMVGYANEGGVSKAYWRAIRRYPAEQVEVHRQNENIKLDDIEARAKRIEDDAVNAADLELALKAQDRRLKVMDRRAKLNGLDAPVKTDVTSGGERVQVEVVPDWMPTKGPEGL